MSKGERTSEPVRIEAQKVAQLRAFSAKTGVTLSYAVNEAVELWLRDVAPLRLEALRKLPKGKA
jgi:predicted DNA-binding protein